MISVKKKVVKLEDYIRTVPLSSNGKSIPQGTSTDVNEIITGFLTPAGDQSVFVVWCKTQEMTYKDLSLMVINFRKWKVEGKKGKTAKEWEECLQKYKDSYTQAAIQTTKPDFNERAFVREMCFKYGFHLATTYFKNDSAYKKFYASKCAIYVKGAAWLMDRIIEQVEELTRFLDDKIAVDQMTYRRPISVIELTRLEDEKNNEADLEGILAWLIFVMEPIFTYTVTTLQVDYMSEIKKIQKEWHSCWEEIISGSEKKTGKTEDLVKRIEGFKNKVPVISNNQPSQNNPVPQNNPPPQNKGVNLGGNLNQPMSRKEKRELMKSLKN